MADITCDSEFNEDPKTKKKINKKNIEADMEGEGEEEMEKEMTDPLKEIEEEIEEIEEETDKAVRDVEKMDERKTNGKIEEKSEPPWNETIVAFKISGSHKEFSMMPENPIARISENAKGIFDENFDSEKKFKINAKDSDPVEKKTKHIIGGMTLLGVQSDFKCSLNIAPIGLLGVKSKSFSSTGEEGGYIVFPEERNNNMNVELIHVKKIKKSIGAFQGRNSETLAIGTKTKHKEEKVFDEKKKKWVSSVTSTMEVDSDHPIISMYNALATKNKKTLLTSKDLNKKKKFEFEEHVGKKLLDLGKQILESQLKVNNLYDLGFQISRAFLSETSKTPIESPSNKRGIIESIHISKDSKKESKKEPDTTAVNSQWLDHTEVLDSYQNKKEMETKAFNINKSLYLRVNVKWRPQEDDN
jgi:hypothetical protein